MSNLPLSIFMICQDEEERIGDALEVLKGLTDDIVIVDSGSTDETLNIAKRYTDRIYHKDWNGYGEQKVYAQSLCQYDWVLNLDADEILQPNVVSEIRQIFKTSEDKRAAAYSLRFCHVGFLSKRKKPRLFCPVNVTPRLYDRRRAGFKDSTVHDKVVTYDGSKPVVLKGDVAHISFKSFGHLWLKAHGYAALQAEDWYNKGKKPSILKIIFDPFFVFLKQYFLRRFFALGVEGFILSFMFAGVRALRLGLVLETFKAKQ